MLYFRTLIGEHIDLSSLRGDLWRLAHLVFAAKETAAQAKRANRRRARRERSDEYASAAFVTEARAIIRQRYVSPSEQRDVLNGPVGAIFRDSYYRLRLAELKPERRAAFLRRIRYRASRILFERFIDSGGSQNDFASNARLDRGAVSALFKTLSETGSEGATGATPAARVSLRRLEDAFEALQIVPRWAYSDESSSGSTEAEVFGTHPDRFTSREAQFVAVITRVAPLILKELESPNSDEKRLHTYRRVLSFYVAWLFGIRSIESVRGVVERLISAIRGRSAFVPIRDEMNETERLLLEKFQLEPMSATTAVPLPTHLFSELASVTGAASPASVSEVGHHELSEDFLAALLEGWSSADTMSSLSYELDDEGTASPEPSKGARGVTVSIDSMPDREVRKGSPYRPSLMFFADTDRAIEQLPVWHVPNSSPPIVGVEQR